MHRKLRLVEVGPSPTRESEPIEQIIENVVSWDGVQLGHHRFGGYEFNYRGGELGHVTPDGMLDLQFPAQMRDRLVAKGWADMHHIFPMSGWVTFRVECKDDVDHAVRLLRIAYRRRRLHIAHLRLRVH